MLYAYLKDRKVIECDVETYAKNYEDFNSRIVGNTTIGDVRISTVFLGIDHAFTEKRPLWFETMIFGGKHDGYQKRFETIEEAEAGHKKAVELVNTLDLV
jgi:hypothetical protein